MDLVSLHDVRPAEMREVLADECRAWRRVLSWDYTATTDTIRRSVGSSGLNGYALRERGRVLAYAYFLPDPKRALIGSVHGFGFMRTLSRVSMWAMPANS